MLLRSEVFLTWVSRPGARGVAAPSEHAEGPLRDDAPELPLERERQFLADRAFAEALHEGDHPAVGAGRSHRHVLELGLRRPARLDLLPALLEERGGTTLARGGEVRRVHLDHGVGLARRPGPRPDAHRFL